MLEYNDADSLDGIGVGGGLGDVGRIGAQSKKSDSSTSRSGSGSGSGPVTQLCLTGEWSALEVSETKADGKYNSFAVLDPGGIKVCTCTQARVIVPYRMTDVVS